MYDKYTCLRLVSKLVQPLYAHLANHSSKTSSTYSALLLALCWIHFYT